METKNAMFNGMFFEVYMRYKMVGLILLEVAKQHGIESPTILEIGSQGVNYLSEFIPKAIVTVSNKTTADVKSISENFLELDATDMRELGDNSFDFVISTAVLEHVPQKEHEQFLSESYRVSKIGSFHAAPFDSDFLIKAERRASDFHGFVLGQKHRWLEEHLEIGHPNLEQISGILNSMGCDYCVFEHGDIDIWETMVKLTWMVQRYDRGPLDYIQDYINKIFYDNVSDTNLLTNIYIAKQDNHSNRVLQFYKDNFSRLSDKGEKDIDAFSTQIMNIMAIRLMRHQVNIFYNNQKQINEYMKKHSILTFVDYINCRQSHIYLYGVTANLVSWFKIIRDLRVDYPVKILDTYKTGPLNEYGCIYPDDIKSPDFQELKEKVVIVFPDSKREEIFEHLYSICAKPVFYKNIV